MAERFVVTAVDPVTLHGVNLLRNRALMSPYVWPARDGGLAVLVRAVPPAEERPSVSGKIWHGRSDDGLNFAMDAAPLIEPGPDESDLNGCEDPTVIRGDDGLIVFYTGLDANFDGQMLYATGQDIGAIRKAGVALASTKTQRHTKEAAVMRAGDGRWRLFYEYAHDCASLIGLAIGDGPTGPWHEGDQPFTPRPGSWDSWHLSTGPLLMTDPDYPVMFYNGATRNAEWGIGWIMFDRGCTRIVDRCALPLIGPPGSGHDGIAFAASLVEAEGMIHLYFSKNDQHLFRAMIARL